MLPIVQSHWSRCREFVAGICASRPATHGLPHMEHVTHLSLLIASLEGTADVIPSGKECFLRDVVIVAMLHDVADHKYDSDGNLETNVRRFLVDQAYAGDAAVAARAWEAIEAISYSKEKKRGNRWFESSLDGHWLAVRNTVSDADKLLAIGEDGLARCWAFQFEMYHMRKARDPSTLEPTAQSLTSDVVQHCHDKLLHLMDDYMMTGAGRFLAAPKQAEMEAVLEKWKADPPSTTTYQGILINSN